MILQVLGGFPMLSIPSGKVSIATPMFWMIMAPYCSPPLWETARDHANANVSYSIWSIQPVIGMTTFQFTSYQFQPTCLIPPFHSPHSAFLPRGSPPVLCALLTQIRHVASFRGTQPEETIYFVALTVPGAVRFLGGLGTGPRFLVERKKFLIKNHHFFRWSGFFFEIPMVYTDFLIH